MKTLALSVALGLAAACAGAAKPGPIAPRLNRWGKPYKEGAVVPSWVDRIPESGKGKLVAVGYSAPTYWPQDAINNAGEEARGKLALALTSHVEVLGIDTADGARNAGGTIDKEATDVVMRNSRIEATWVDENGERSDPGGAWALASIDIELARGRAGAPEAMPAAATMKGVPAWLERLPAAQSKIYAAGYSGPTFEKEAALRYASDNAIENLAASLRARVQAYTLLVESGSGLSRDEFAQTDDPDHAFLDLVRKSAKVEATWVDKDGVRPGDPPGAVWALASIDVKSTQGGIRAVENEDLGPALDAKGNAAPPASPAK